MARESGDKPSRSSYVSSWDLGTVCGLGDWGVRKSVKERWWSEKKVGSKISERTERSFRQVIDKMPDA